MKKTITVCGREYQIYIAGICLKCNLAKAELIGRVNDTFRQYLLKAVNDAGYCTHNFF
jgi:hypothetical protein